MNKNSPKNVITQKISPKNNEYFERSPKTQRFLDLGEWMKLFILKHKNIVMRYYQPFSYNIISGPNEFLLHKQNKQKLETFSMTNDS